MQLLLFAETIQLFPDGTLFIHVALILLMIYVLNRTLYRPINRVLEARERNKGGHSSEADAILAEVESKESKYVSELLKARSKGYEHIEKEQKKAAAASEKQLSEAKKEISATQESERADLERQTAEARAMIGAEAEKLGDRIASGILKI